MRNVFHRRVPSSRARGAAAGVVKARGGRDFPAAFAECQARMPTRWPVYRQWAAHRTDNQHLFRPAAPRVLDTKLVQCGEVRGCVRRVGFMVEQMRTDPVEQREHFPWSRALSVGLCPLACCGSGLAGIVGPPAGSATTRRCTFSSGSSLSLPGVREVVFHGSTPPSSIKGRRRAVPAWQRRRRYLAKIRLFVVLVNACRALRSQHEVRWLERIETTVVTVVGDGGGREALRSSQQPEPPAKVYVLEEGKIIGVEAAYRQEYVSLDKHQFSCSEQQIARFSTTSARQR